MAPKQAWEEGPMAEKVNVEIGGRSKYEMAIQMADTILLTIEKKKLSEVSRQQYLEAVYQSIVVLNQGWPL
jgi:hypothetical protein